MSWLTVFIVVYLQKDHNKFVQPLERLETVVS